MSPIECQISPVFKSEISEAPHESHFEVAFLARVLPYGARVYDVVGFDKMREDDQDQHKNHCVLPQIINIFQKVATTGGSILSADYQHGPFTIKRMSSTELLALPPNDSARLLTLETLFLKARLSPINGTIVEFTTKVAEKRQNTTTNNEQSRTQVHKLKINFVSYTARGGAERSGAYLFLPNPEPREFLPGFEQLRLIKGPLFSEALVVKHKKYLHQYLRLFNSPGHDGRSIEIENHMDINDILLDNHEIAMLVETDVNNSELNTSVPDSAHNRRHYPVFYTDLNAFQMTKRVARLEKLPVQANFFPMPSTACLQDKKTRFTILSGQPLGVASLAQGQLQIILDRRLAQDDNRGLDQAVQDNKPETSSQFKLILESMSSTGENLQLEEKLHKSSLFSQHVSLSLLHPLMVYFFENISTAVGSPYYEIFKSSYLLNSLLSDSNIKSPLAFTAISAPLPCDVHLLNIRTEVAVENSGETFEPAPHALILLQRLGVSCETLSVNVGGCDVLQAGSSFVLGHVFAGFSRQKWALVERKNLSPLHHGQAWNATDLVDLKAMDIECFRVPLDVNVRG